MRAIGVIVSVLFLLSGIRGEALASSRVAENVISHAGVKVVAPRWWRLVVPAGDGKVVDPKTVLVVGTAGVTASLTSSCQVAAYRLSADGAVVVVVRWRTVTSGGGR